MPGLKELLGDNIVGRDGAKISVESIAENEQIGLYFSAHWCPPCRAFTPVLVNCYNTLKKQGKKFEIIFISSDKEQKSFDEYYGTMPWLALSFDDRDRKNQISKKFDIKGIPCLVLLDSSGNIVNKNGRTCVANDEDGCDFPWK
ncbi:nucleoredoxin-like [Babylonia areolata]|uniref:nucleoredoxin-like n=1 Tax=Babylonia areolata TaxID=304850 RepID=UPI003FD0464D